MRKGSHFNLFNGRNPSNNRPGKQGKSLALNENANYNSIFWPYLNIPLLSCLCFSEHNNLSDHLLHMSRDFSPFKFYCNCYLLHHKIPWFPTIKCNLSFHSSPAPLFCISLRADIDVPILHLCIVNYKQFKGRDDDLPTLVFLGHQAKWLPHRGYLINSCIKFA